MKCLVRNQDWRTEESIFLAGLRVSHTNAKLWNNVGHALESRKAYSQALTFFQQATSGNLFKGYCQLVECSFICCLRLLNGHRRQFE